MLIVFLSQYTNKYFFYYKVIGRKGACEMIKPRNKRTKKGISSIDETPFFEVIELLVG